MNRFFRSALFPLIVIVLLVYLASSQLMGGKKNPTKVTLSEFITDVKSHDVENASFNPNKRQITFQLTNGKKGSVHYPSDQSAPSLTNLLEQNNVRFDSKGTGSSAWWSLLTGLLPFVLLFGFWIFLMNQVQGGGSKVMSFGK
ncbi:MAG: ATP-dependent metallopeptidase FtsH/Yme1/Tma family protein, partial [Actinomycetota bacterium]